MSLADIINQYIDETKPWVIAKEPGREKNYNVFAHKQYVDFQRS